MGFAAMDPFGFGVQSSTPPVPPGISPPSFPLPNGPSEPILLDTVKAPSRIVPTSAPFTPSRPPPSQTLVGPPMDNMSGPPTPTQGISSTRIHELSTAQAKQDVKAFAGISGLSKTIISQGPQAKLQSEDFPALERSKAKSTSVTSPAKLTPTVKATSGAANAKKPASTLSSNVSASQPPIRQAEKKSLPSVLNILTSPSKPEIAEKTVTASSSFPPLPPSTPSVSSHPTLPRPTTAGVKSTKTLPTSKIETPIATPSSTSSAFPSNYYATRQPSLASISKLERSGTPTSEIISDNASITSASISRANSPPPSKIGSAPVRVNTKSMQKKQRKEIQKENLKQELEAAATKPEPEAEIGPIMGRKKKQKKERTGSSAAGGSTPAASRPPSPGPGTASIREEITVEVSEQQDTASEKPQLEKATNNLTKQTSDNKNKGKAKVQRPPSPEPVSAVTETHEEPTEKPIPTPASIFQELISSGAIEDIANLNFLKLPNSSGRHQDPQSDLQNAIPKLTITPEDRAALLAGKLVRKNVDGPNRIMLTPNGDCVRNLTPEEEQRYLNLQASIAKENGPAAFFSAKHHTTNGFALVGGRAVPNGPPAFFPQSASAIDPVSKIQRDEALSYINQYVLPSLHTNSQLEKALNANALDAEMMRSSDSAAWSSWGNDPAGLSRPETDSGFNATHEGILATGLQNMTAHFAIGRDIDRGQPLGNVSMLSLTDAESAMHMARKETEGLEKRLIALLKRNKRVLVGSGH